MTAFAYLFISWFCLCFSQSLWLVYVSSESARAHVSLLFICVSKSPNFRFLYVTTIFEIYGHLFHSTIYRLTQSLVIVSDSHITFLLLIILSFFFSFNAFSVFIERFFPFEIRRRRKKNCHLKTNSDLSAGGFYEALKICPKVDLTTFQKRNDSIFSLMTFILLVLFGKKTLCVCGCNEFGIEQRKPFNWQHFVAFYLPDHVTLSI